MRSFARDLTATETSALTGLSVRTGSGEREAMAPVEKIVFRLLKRGGVDTDIVPNASQAFLQAVIRGKSFPVSLIHVDGWRGYDGRVDLGFDRHFRSITVRMNTPGVRITSIRISRKTFCWHLKETEFRFNHRHGDLFKILLKWLGENPLRNERSFLPNDPKENQKIDIETPQKPF